jgi:hypothetical protein
MQLELSENGKDVGVGGLYTAVHLKEVALERLLSMMECIAARVRRRSSSALVSYVTLTPLPLPLPLAQSVYRPNL